MKHLEEQWRARWMLEEEEEEEAGWGETPVPCYSTFVLTIAPSDAGN